MLRVLAELGADLNSAACGGIASAHLAAYNGFNDSIRALGELGVDQRQIAILRIYG